MRPQRTITGLACGLALTLSTTGASAQERAAAGDLKEIRKVSALLDSDVFNRTNEQVASVEDLILSPDGSPRFAVVSRGGVAGVGASFHAVPWEALQVRHDNGKWAVNLDASKEALEKAPKFESDNYQELMSAPFVSRTRDFFRPPGEGHVKAGESPLAIVIRASKLVDAGLRNNRDEDLGEVEDLLLDQDYHVAFAVIGRGGILDIGESYVPVPWSKLRLRVDREDGSITALLDATKQQLEQAPLIKGDNYATLLGPGYIEQVYRHFGVAQSGASSRASESGHPQPRD